MSRAILWDFDGTLGYRSSVGTQRGFRWAACLVDALDQVVRGHGVRVEDLRPHLHSGFPWHTPETPHLDLCEPDAWWARFMPVLDAALVATGVDAAIASDVTRAARATYIDPARWRLFDDSVPVLTALREDGWRHVILSNHVPELDDIVTYLGLDALIDDVVNSARTGYEKPHPESFAIARRRAGSPDVVWMVGDSPDADVAGAERVGIPAILVRHEGAPDLAYVLETLRSAGSTF